MASYSEKTKSPVKARRRETCLVHVKGTFGSSGAVTDARLGGGGTIAKTATGRYTITLEELYTTLLGVCITPQLVSGTAADMGRWYVYSVDMSAGTVQLGHTTQEAETTLADPASGDAVYVTLHLAKSSVK